MSKEQTPIEKLGFEIGVLVRKDNKTWASSVEADGFEAYWNDESPDTYGGIEIFKKDSDKLYGFVYREEQFEAFRKEFPNFFK